VLNTVLSAFLTFSDRVLYQPYQDAPRLFGTTALSDQAAAGLIMWVPGSLVFLVPAVVLAIRLLSPAGSLIRPGANIGKPRLYRGHGGEIQRSIERYIRCAQNTRLGPILRARSGRRILQATLLIVAVAVIADDYSDPNRVP